MTNTPRFEQSWTLFDEARRLIPLGTGTHTKAPNMPGQEPAYFVRGRGCRLWDLDDHEYIDFRNALGPITLGHAHPEVQAAIARQLEDGLIFSGPHPLEVELARLLTGMIPAAEQVRYLKTGGEAMAAVIKLARAYTGRDLILSSGYHGWLQSVHSQAGVPDAVATLTRTYPYGDLDAVAALLEANPGRVAAITLAGSYPDMTPDASFAQGLRKLASTHGALLIIDEIVTGFRLAHGGWHEYYGITPDLAVFSKGIANGMPLSVYLGRREVMQEVERGAVVSSTFSGETLSLAAAKAVLEIYQREPVIERLWTRATQLGDGMRQIFIDHDLPIQLKGLAPCPRLIFDAENPSRGQRLRAALFARAAQRGVLLFDVPYVNDAHGEEDIAQALDRIDNACRGLDPAHLPDLTSPFSDNPRIGASAT